MLNPTEFEKKSYNEPAMGVQSKESLPSLQELPYCAHLIRESNDFFETIERQKKHYIDCDSRAKAVEARWSQTEKNTPYDTVNTLFSCETSARSLLERDESNAFDAIERPALVGKAAMERVIKNKVSLILSHPDFLEKEQQLIKKATDSLPKKTAEELKTTLLDLRAQLVFSEITPELFKNRYESVINDAKSLLSCPRWKKALYDVLNALIYVCTLTLLYHVKNRYRIFVPSEESSVVANDLKESLDNAFK